MSAIFVTSMPSASFAADSQNRRVNIINKRSHTIGRFSASNADENNWQEDILGSRVLQSGRAVLINIDDGTGHCLYDFKAVLEDGTSSIRKGVNVCRLASYRYTD